MGVVNRANDWLSHTPEASPMSTTPKVQSTKTTVDLWSNGFFNQHARRAFSTFAALQMRWMQDRVMERVSACESPLEAAFFAWWIVINTVGASSLELVPQHEVTLRGRRYRLDFAVVPILGARYSMLVGLENAPKVCIELDGHHYHDKTKAQVTKRNRRDRDLAAEQWTVLHASYSEFHDDPVGTVTAIVGDADRVFQQAVTGRFLAE